MVLHESVPQAADWLQQGRDALQQGRYFEAVDRYNRARARAAAENDNHLLAQATQMYAVCLAQAGELHLAVLHSEKAVDIAIKTGDDLLYARALRDLGRQYHLYMLLCRKTNRPIDSRGYMEKALITLVNALNNFELRHDEAEASVTRGMYGHLLADIGSRSVGVSEISAADKMLQKSESRVFETNNLVKLIRTSPLHHRLNLLPRAFKLTTRDSASPGSRKKVWAALLGNKMCTQLEVRRFIRLANHGETEYA